MRLSNVKQCALMAMVMAVATMVAAAGQGSFVNWASPHVHPLDMTPDGARLLVVNTADNRLEVFTIDGSSLQPAGAVPVGLDPVSVRARTDSEAWVVNHVSDTISVVDLSSMTVVMTLRTGDEPADVVFAGAPQCAYVSVSQLNQVKVFDPADLAAPPLEIDIEGEDPRALATDGQTVYAAIFESGNRTTILPGSGDISGASAETTVSDPKANPYPGAPNPPPNSGAGFDPPLRAAFQQALADGCQDDDVPDDPNCPPQVSLILKKNAGTGQWLDDNGGDWSAAIDWDLHDHDVAVIDTDSLAVTYVTGLMNLNMGLSVRSDSHVVVVGTEAINEVRFEPNLNGVFVRAIVAQFTGDDLATATMVDLNPHLDYSTPTVPQDQRDQSIGDPLGIAWNETGDIGYITGTGSNNVIVVDAALERVGAIDAGEGPTGVRLNAGGDLLYVLNRFEGAVSVFDAEAATELARVPFYDPTPEVIRLGRPHFFDTHRTSGLGQVSCASCHVDGQMDHLAWDLGDPSGDLRPFDQTCNEGLPDLTGVCEDYHPMKGPMTTQTLVGAIGNEPMHWRGDRGGLSLFNASFQSLLGDDEQLTREQLDQLESFLATLTAPPNPYRKIFGSFETEGANGGNAAIGQGLFNAPSLDGMQCATCHATPDGSNDVIVSANLLHESQSFKIPQLRNMYEKTGFDRGSTNNSRGFGFIHDGSVDTIQSFLTVDGFTAADDLFGEHIFYLNEQERDDLEAFLFSFSTDTHAGIGYQTTFGGPLATADTTLRLQMIAVAGSSDEVGLVVKGLYGDEHRGFYFSSGSYVSDRVGEVVTLADLDAGVAAGGVLTYTLVPEVSQLRIGVDRDEDGFLDRDELDGFADPADPDSIPAPGRPGDLNGDDAVDVDDLIMLILVWGPCEGECCLGDLDEDGHVGVDDLVTLVLLWG